MLKSILFVCTGNTCRSPMAEGLFKKMLSDRGYNWNFCWFCWDYGFWIFPASHYAIEVMNEEGIDISAHRSKKLQVI